MRQLYPGPDARAMQRAMEKVRSFVRVAVAANYAATAEDDQVEVNATAAARTVTLPPAATLVGGSITVWKTDASANAVTVQGDGSETINGSTDTLSNQYDHGIYYPKADGSGWLQG